MVVTSKKERRKYQREMCMIKRPRRKHRVDGSKLLRMLNVQESRNVEDAWVPKYFITEQQRELESRCRRKPCHNSATREGTRIA